jgi:lipopolysaccharide export system protein LptA
VRTPIKFLQSAVVALLVAAPACAFAQGAANKGQSNALQGFSENRNKPVQIEAATLEVREKEKKATFSGNVKVVQGDTMMQSKALVVFYEQDASGGNMKAAQPGPGGSQQISKLEATGGVKVTQKDQIATGDSAYFDMRANTVTLNGNVTVTQGKNIMKGDRLVVDMTTGVSRVEGKGPVRLLIEQDGNNNANAQQGASGGNSAKPGFMQGPKLGPRPFPSN